MKKIMIGLVIIALVGAAGFYFKSKGSAKQKGKLVEISQVKKAKLKKPKLFKK